MRPVHISGGDDVDREKRFEAQAPVAYRCTRKCTFQSTRIDPCNFYLLLEVTASAPHRKCGAFFAGIIECKGPRARTPVAGGGTAFGMTMARGEG
jgi:hypothetical protein